jgi:8-oxo-dGTP diphosphatase
MTAPAPAAPQARFRGFSQGPTLISRSVKAVIRASTGQATPVVDAFWRTAFRFGFPVARIWSRLKRQEHEGALVAVYVGCALLLVRSSYRQAWNFPGGGMRRSETPEAAAGRELAEETGISGHRLDPVGSACGVWDGRRERVYFFELRLDALPELRLDNREIIGARLVAPDELRTISVTGPVARYLGRAECEPHGRLSA